MDQETNEDVGPLFKKLERNAIKQLKYEALSFLPQSLSQLVVVVFMFCFMLF